VVDGRAGASASGSTEQYAESRSRRAAAENLPRAGASDEPEPRSVHGQGGRGAPTVVSLAAQDGRRGGGQVGDAGAGPEAPGDRGDLVGIDGGRSAAAHRLRPAGHAQGGGKLAVEPCGVTGLGELAAHHDRSPEGDGELGRKERDSEDEARARSSRQPQRPRAADAGEHRGQRDGDDQEPRDPGVADLGHRGDHRQPGQRDTRQSERRALPAVHREDHRGKSRDRDRQTQHLAEEGDVEQPGMGGVGDVGRDVGSRPGAGVQQPSRAP